MVALDFDAQTFIDGITVGGHERIVGIHTELGVALGQPAVNQFQGLCSFQIVGNRLHVEAFVELDTVEAGVGAGKSHSDGEAAQTLLDDEGVCLLQMALGNLLGQPMHDTHLTVALGAQVRLPGVGGATGEHSNSHKGYLLNIRLHDGMAKNPPCAYTTPYTKRNSFAMLLNCISRLTTEY